MEAYLTILTGGREGELIPIRCPATIGRAAVCDVRIDDDETVSARHAKIYLRDNFYVIEDLRARNGTLVNGRPIRMHFLKSGDVIKIGETQFRFTAPAAATERPVDSELAEQIEVAADDVRRNARPGFSRLAVGSVICGVGACGPWPHLAVFSLAAVVLAALAMASIKRGAARGAPAAAAGLILGTATGIYHLREIAYLPYIAHKREAECRNNLRAIHEAIMKYRTDHAGRYPDSLDEILSGYLRDPEALRCPASERGGKKMMYIYLASGSRDTASPVPVAADPDPAAHGKPGGNVLYSDGKIRHLSAEEMAAILEKSVVGKETR